MADFPVSPHTFTNFANGALSDAAQVTDIYSEVEAIELGYLTGTARLNSSHSTVAALSVTGGSTLATLSVSGGSTLGGTLQVSGNTTLAGTLAVTGNSSFAGSLHVAVNSTITGSLTVSSNATIVGTLTVGGVEILARATAQVSVSAAVDVAHDTWTGVSWNVEDDDSTALHSTSVNSSRVHLRSTGVWLFGTQALWNVNANPSTAALGVRVLVNDVTALAGDRRLMAAWASGQPVVAAQGRYLATDTANYLTVQAWHNTVSTCSLMGSSGGGYGPTQFWVQKVSQ